MSDIAMGATVIWTLIVGVVAICIRIFVDIHNDLWYNDKGNPIEADLKEELDRSKKRELTPKSVWYMILWIVVILLTLNKELGTIFPIVISIALATYTVAVPLYRIVRVLEKIYRRINEDQFE